MACLNSAFFDQLRPCGSYLEQLHERVWLMDDHKWAYWVWENHRHLTEIRERYELLHFDYHFDAINDFYNNPEESTLLLTETLDQIKTRIGEDQYIRYDSFIAPALLRGFISHVHFFCMQTAEETDIGIDNKTLQLSDAQQSFYDSIDQAAQAPVASPYIFDLCLDVFNLNPTGAYDGELWPKEQILHAMETWRELIANADLVTVSLSFGCSGTEDDTRYLAQLVLPLILQTVEHC